MSSKLLDADLILSENEEWTKLDQDWKAVDLEEDEPGILSPKLSTLDLRKSTFDSSFLFKRVRRKIGRRFSKKSADLEYKDFLEDLKDDGHQDLPLKQFYFISGQILSALSVEEICDKIDDIFRSVDRLCSATSTVRQKKRVMPDVVQCSISGTGLSFDESEENLDEEREKCDDDDVDRYIDEAFAQLNTTMASLENNLENNLENLDQSTKESVTTLVKKFSNFLSSPQIKSPRRKRPCSDRFRDLAEFWKTKAFEL